MASWQELEVANLDQSLNSWKNQDPFVFADFSFVLKFACRPFLQRFFHHRLLQELRGLVLQCSISAKLWRDY